MRPLDILFDMDGILADCTKAWLAWIAERRGAPALEDEVLHWNMQKNFPDVPNVDEAIRTPGFFRRLDPIEGALEMVHELHQDGHKILICSTPSRVPESAADKLYWIAEHLPMVKLRTDVYLCGGKHRVRGDVFVDDSPDNLRSYQKRNKGTLTCTIDYQGNRHVPVDVRGFGWTCKAEACRQITQGIRSYAERLEEED